MVKYKLKVVTTDGTDAYVYIRFRASSGRISEYCYLDDPDFGDLEGGWTDVFYFELEEFQGSSQIDAYGMSFIESGPHPFWRFELWLYRWIDDQWQLEAHWGEDTIGGDHGSHREKLYAYEYEHYRTLQVVDVDLTDSSDRFVPASGFALSDKRSDVAKKRMHSGDAGQKTE